MKKVLISGLIFVLAMIGLITFCFAGYSSYNAVEDEGDLAEFAWKKSSLFLGVTSTGKLLKIGGSAIYKPTATCLYHTQSNRLTDKEAFKEQKSIVRYIIDTKINSEGKAVINLNGVTKVSDEETALKLGYALYAAYRVRDDKNINNPKKTYVRYLLLNLINNWHEMNDFKSNDSNGVSNDGWSSIEEEANKYASRFKGKEVPSKQSTTPAIDTTNGKIGPFKVKYGGCEVNYIKLSITETNDNGTTTEGAYQDVKIYDKDGNEYKQDSTGNENKRVPYNEDFYVKCTSKTSAYKLAIQFKRVEYTGKVLLVANDLKEGQNLATYSASRKPTRKTLKWGGESETTELGKLTIYKVDDDTEAVLQGAKFKITGPITDQSEGTSVELETDADGKITLDNLALGKYTISETAAPAGYNLSLQSGYNVTTSSTDGIEVEIEEGDELEKTFGNRQYGNLQIIKKDIGGTATLERAGFQFKIYYIDSEGKAQYIQSIVNAADQPAHLTYTEDINQARVFVTGTDGKTEILYNIPLGNYYVQEIAIPSELEGYYDVDPNPKMATVVNNVNGTDIVTTEFSYENIPKAISIDGYVWEDRYQEKISTRNNLLDLDLVNKDKNEGKAGYPVELYVMENGSPKVVATTYTNDYGKYEFKYVDYNTLMQGGFFVRILYDAIQYQSVDPNVTVANGAKAKEKDDGTSSDREWVNQFNTINPTGGNGVNLSNKDGVFLTSDGVNNLTINYSVADHKATTIGNSGINMVSSTANTEYVALQNYVENDNGIRYVRNVNFGIYKIPPTDLAIGQDLEFVNVGVNGYWHIYKYGATNYDYDNTNSWDVGVRFMNSRGTYNRAVYESDLNYNPSDDGKKLQIYLTYKIVLKNESSYYTKVNNMIEYYDPNYTVVSAGTGLNGYDTTGDVSHPDDINYNNNNNNYYNRCIMYTNNGIQIAPGSTEKIYVQFKINKIGNNLWEFVTNGTQLYTIAEINSYSVFTDDKYSSPIAVLDIDSVPGNAIPGNVDTYEDDTEGAPPVKLVNGGARTISGKVFLDSTSEELMTKNVRQGDGIYDQEVESGVGGVKVTLHEVNGSIEDIIADTGDNGDYSLSGFIPGIYTLTYTWGNDKYTVQNYKGTVYDVNREDINNYGDQWYKYEVNTRRTDAIDNYETRQKIDRETASITDYTINNEVKNAYTEAGSSSIQTTKMDSTTPLMKLRLECNDETDISTMTEHGWEGSNFNVPNVDFGIVERARQQLDMRKRISKLRIKLANEQILADAEVNEDGTLRGQTNYLTYMGPSLINNISDNGFLKAEMDNELIEGATLEVTYEIKIVNNSEKDYMSEAFYKYGQEEGEIVTLKPSAVVDYLDSDWGFIPSDNLDWKQITIDELRTLNASKVNDTNFLYDRIILCTVKTAEALKPGENVSVTLNVSKLLTTSNDSIFKNDAEVVKVEKPTSEEHRGSVIKYFPFATAEDVNIIPSTGENMGYVLITVIFIIALLVLGIGIFIIIKLVL